MIVWLPVCWVEKAAAIVLLFVLLRLLELIVWFVLISLLLLLVFVIDDQNIFYGGVNITEVELVK